MEFTNKELRIIAKALGIKLTTKGIFKKTLYYDGKVFDPAASHLLVLQAHRYLLKFYSSVRTSYIFGFGYTAHCIGRSVSDAHDLGSVLLKLLAEVEG